MIRENRENRHIRDRTARELRVEVFKYVDTPISLLLTDRKWYATSQDPRTKAEWLIYKYGKAHALFHAIRIANTFITPDVVNSLLSKEAVFSRYLIQRMLLQVGFLDEKLIDQRFQAKIKSATDLAKVREYYKNSPPPWASKLPIPVFCQLLTEATKRLGPDNNLLRGNDLELFHFLSGGPHVIDYAPKKLQEHLREITDLILNKRFIPFPPRPIKISASLEEFPSKDGYENYRQLNVIARAIIIHPGLVNMWKQVGYHEICSDVNELVIQGGLLLLFPPNTSSGWKYPDVDNVIESLTRLFDVGFYLNRKTVSAAERLFKDRPPIVSNVLREAFSKIDPKLLADV